MAQIIRLRRGTLAELSSVTLSNGELGVVTSSVANVGDAVLKSALVVGHTDGTNRLSIARVITGNATPDLSGITGGAAFNDMLYHETDAKTLKVLNTGGNTTLDLSGNISVSEIAGNVSASVTSTGSFGYLNVDGDAVIGGNLTFGDAATDYVSFSADISSSITPDSSDSFNLGSDSQRWDTLYLSGSISASGGPHSIISATTIDLDAEGALTIDGGSITIGGDSDVAFDIDTSTLDIDSSGAVTLDTSAGGVSIDAAAASNFSTAAGALTLHGAGGVNLGTTADVAFDIDTAALDIDSSGAITIDGTSTVSIDGADDMNFTITSGTGGEDLTIAQLGANDSSIIITAAGTGADAVSVDATAGSMVIGASLVDEKTLTLGNTSSTYLKLTPHGTAASEKVLLYNAAGTADDAIKIHSDAGGVTIKADNDSLHIDADGTDADALNIDSAGGIDVDAAAAVDILAASTLTAKGATGASLGDDTGTWEFDGDGALSETGMTTVSITPSSTLDLDAGGAVTIDGSSITLGGDSDVAFDIDTSTLDIDSSDAVTIDVAGAGISMDAAGASNLTTSAGALTLEGFTGISLKESGSDVIAIDTNRDVLFSATGGTTSDPDVEFDGYTRFDGVTEVADSTNSTSITTGAFIVDGGVGIAKDLVVGGSVTAQEFHTEFISASVIYESGSTRFGDTTDDTHAFTGSLTTSGSSLTINSVGTYSGSATSTGSFGRVVTSTLDADGGTIDGATIGATSHTTIKGTTIDATTDFTIDGLVLTADTITNDSNLTMDLAGDLAIDVDGGDVTITDDGADLATINATKISGSSTSTGSFGALTVADGVTTTLSPISSDGAALGSISDMWSDLFLADAGVINFNNGNSTITGGSALINVNVPIRGTKLEIDSASDYLDVSTDLQIIAAADITLNPGGNNVKPGGDSEDDLGVDGTAWRKLFVDDIDLNGQGRIDLDADADTSVRASADDVITFEAGAVDITQMTATMTVSGSSISTGSFSDLMATGTGASVAASSASLVSFKDNSTSQFGYLATADSEAVTAGLVGYNASNGNLTISSIVDGGSF